MPGDNVYEDAVDFLLKYVLRTGHNPETHQAQGLLVRIEEARLQATLDDEPPEKHAPVPSKHGHDLSAPMVAHVAPDLKKP